MISKRCMPLSRLLPLALLGVALIVGPHNTSAQVFDGPYVIRGADDQWQNWSVVVSDAGLTKEASPVAVGDRLIVDAVGRRPSFTVKLRNAASPAPEKVRTKKGAPIFFMADSHGEYEIATELLIQHGVIDNRLKWHFGRGHLVVLGDVFDRGPRQTELLWLLYELEAEAAAAGGRVHLVLGNHEVMAMTGDSRYLHYRYDQAATALGVGHYAELWGRTSLLGQWLRSKPGILKMDSVLCLHGGISPLTLAGKWNVSDINSAIREWLTGTSPVDPEKIEFIAGNDGPLWYRGLVSQEDEPEHIDAVRSFYRVKRIVVGHTKVGTVTALYTGSVVAAQVYPTQDEVTGRMKMEGVYVDPRGVWHKARVDGTREALQ